MNSSQLVCYHPTTVYSVDDNQKFFITIKLAVDSQRAVCKFSDDPQLALKFLTREHKSNPFTKYAVIDLEDQSMDKLGIEIDIRAIKQAVFNPQRFEEISVVILDYAMPGLNGGQLAQQLKNYPFKVILLTGEADTKIAVELFNQGIIHSYIRKDDKNFKTVIKTTIENLQYDYFLDLSSIIINSLVQKPNIQRTWFKDPSFNQLLQKICKDNDIIEYYLLDEQGSYQLLNSKGKISFFAVADEEMLETYAMLASHDNASPSIVNNLNTKKMIPFFYSDDDLNVRPSEWPEYLHPAQLLEGKSNYYYAYITDTKKYVEDTNEITPYTKFLSK